MITEKEFKSILESQGFDTYWQDKLWTTVDKNWMAVATKEQILAKCEEWEWYTDHTTHGS